MISRRAALQAGAASITTSFWNPDAQAQAAPPKRLVLIHRPNGTLQSEWVKSGATGLSRGDILRGFDSVWAHAVVPKGLQVIPNGGVGTHEAGMVAFLTGHPIGETRPQVDDDWKNTARSVDQVLLDSSPSLRGRPISGAHLAGHLLYDGPEVSDRVLSYTGVDAPVFPEVDPVAAFARLFGPSLPGAGLTESELIRARARSRSVLDFLAKDLKRLSARLPASERSRFDAHTTSLRELEGTLARKYASTPGCSAGTAPPASSVGNHYRAVGDAAKSHFEIIRTAFRCDITRVASFLWSPGTSKLAFDELFPGMPLVAHHLLSHQDPTLPDVNKMLAAIDRWYAEQTAAFVESLATTADPQGGSLLDNTLVIYFSEIGQGDHSFANMPIALFGGPGVGIHTGGRIVDVSNRPTNDLWLSVAAQFGVTLQTLGAPNQTTGPIAGLFA